MLFSLLMPHLWSAFRDIWNLAYNRMTPMNMTVNRRMLLTIKMSLCSVLWLTFSAYASTRLCLAHTTGTRWPQHKVLRQQAGFARLLQPSSVWGKALVAFGWDTLRKGDDLLLYHWLSPRTLRFKSEGSSVVAQMGKVRCKMAFARSYGQGGADDSCFLLPCIRLAKNPVWYLSPSHLSVSRVPASSVVSFLC